MSRDEEAGLGIENPQAYEQTDVRATGVMIFLAGLFAALGASVLVIWWLYGVFAPNQAAVRISPAEIPPEPRIQSAPLVDLWRIRAHEDAVLESYGWVDKQAGVVRIPIDRAIDILAERGLPARTGTGAIPGVPDTGPESGGPQTGRPVPRLNPATPFVSSQPLMGPAEIQDQR